MLDKSHSKNPIKISSKDTEYIYSVMPKKIEGVEEVCARDNSGMPRVIRCAAVIRNKPFSTLYWLVNPIDIHEVSLLESNGYITQIEKAIEEFHSLRLALNKAHRQYQREREKHINPEQKQILKTLGLENVFEKRGISGMEDFNSVKCLHSHLAQHLASYNPIGQWTEQAIQKKTPEEPLEFFSRLFEN